MPSPFIHIHIHRTGGTSLQSTLDTCYPNATCRLHLESDFKNIPLHWFREYKMIQGHFCWGVHRLTHTDPLYFTFLRHPARRIMSLMSRWGNECNEREFLRRLSVGEYRAMEVENASVLQCAGFECIDSWRYKTASRDDLERAKQHLSEMVFVGFTRYYSESIRGLEKVTGWDLSNMMNINRTPFHLSYPEKGSPIYDAIIERYPLGVELYEWAVDNFMGKIL